jgi:Cu+-exporting ATPase
MMEKLNVEGMHCTSCAKLIESRISKMNGIKSVKVSYADEIMEIEFDENKIQLKDIIGEIEKLGYTASKKEKMNEKKIGFLEKLFGGKK